MAHNLGDVLVLREVFVVLFVVVLGRLAKDAFLSRR